MSLWTRSWGIKAEHLVNDEWLGKKKTKLSDRKLFILLLAIAERTFCIIVSGLGLLGCKMRLRNKKRRFNS